MDAITTLTGSVPFTTTKVDGTTEDVQIRTIKLKDFRRLAVARSTCSYHAEAEAYCDKPPGWGETISDESIDAIVQHGRSVLNVDFFARWCRDQVAFQAMVRPDAPSIDNATGSTSGSPTSRLPAG